MILIDGFMLGDQQALDYFTQMKTNEMALLKSGNYEYVETSLGKVLLNTAEYDAEIEREKQSGKYNCDRCGGSLYFGSCDCYWSPGDPMNSGEWIRDN